MKMPASILTRLDGKSIREILWSGPRYIRKELIHRGIARYYKRQLHADAAQRTERRQEAITYLAECGTILFLCHGNICRGPFAERYARQQLRDHGIDSITVTSAGFTDLDDPTSPPEARSAAAQYGVDLSEHRAVQADAESLRRADLILLMDYRNYHTFTRRFPAAADRMFLLRLFDADASMQIDDPYGAGPAAFTTAYDEIRDCVDTLIRSYETLSSPVDPLEIRGRL